MKDELKKVPKTELENRLTRLRQRMDQQHPGWSVVFIHHKINMYYFTGTMQDGVLVIRPQDAILWVRRSLERGQKESEWTDIRPMRSFRILAEHYGNQLPEVFLETDQATYEWMQMLRKYFNIGEIRSICPVTQYLRARKSEYELERMKQAGAIHQEVMEKLAPTFLREGISEAELGIEIYREMIRRGRHGIARFHMPLGEDVIGVVSFGKSGLVSMAFDSPDGTAGTCVAVQSLGSAARQLKPGTVVFFDIASGMEGYHTDKSIIYYFGDLRKDPRGEEIRRANNFCINLERKIASMLKPGAIPKDIYQAVLSEIPEEYADSFMNGGKFLGHSIGLMMDETPVLAASFTEPLEEGMTFAVEPKIALKGVGLVGTENTYLVTPEGGVSLTGSCNPLRMIR